MARILVADDDEDARAAMQQLLLRAGHEVETAPDGQAALDLLSKRDVDLLVTDLRMPRLGGDALIRRVRATWPEVEIVVVTAFGTIESAVEAIRLGAYDYLQKPTISAEAVRCVIERALEHRDLVAFRNRARRSEPEVPPLGYTAPTMVPVVEALRRVAPTNATVLLLGESGTGKEVAARAVHRWSQRADGPFVAVNCMAFAEGLLESELFGHEKGAFSGAEGPRQGRLELARGGTFFLDEIGELRPEVQVKLLRVLQERTFERVGSSRTLNADVRWVAATNADLKMLVKDGVFREDLYHRLAVFPVKIPPLRERPEDIAPLARLILSRIATEQGRPPLTLEPDAELRLMEAPWSGNVRELRNVLERASIMVSGTVISADDLWLETVSSDPAQRKARLEEIERETIARVLAEVGGNRTKAAQKLGIALRTLHNKLNRHGLREP